MTKFTTILTEASSTDHQKLGDIMNKMLELDTQMRKITSKEDWQNIDGDEDFFKYYEKVRNIVKTEIPNFKWK
jgi:hypothetical protein